jgi:hypothetical protein
MHDPRTALAERFAQLAAQFHIVEEKRNSDRRLSH